MIYLYISPLSSFIIIVIIIIYYHFFHRPQHDPTKFILTVSFYTSLTNCLARALQSYNNFLELCSSYVISSMPYCNDLLTRLDQLVVLCVTTKYRSHTCTLTPTHTFPRKRTQIASTYLSHDISYASSCIFDDKMQLLNDIRQG